LGEVGLALLEEGGDAFASFRRGAQVGDPAVVHVARRDAVGTGVGAGTQVPSSAGPAMIRSPFVSAASMQLAKAVHVGAEVHARAQRRVAAREHEVARAYVLYREKRAQERAQAKGKDRAGVADHVVHVVENGVKKPLDLERLRELMPRAIFLLPGVGAQGGSAGELEAAFAGPGSALVTASRSVASAPDPAAAAEELRAQVWSVAGD